jgi:hypothetical protein
MDNQVSCRLLQLLRQDSDRRLRELCVSSASLIQEVEDLDRCEGEMDAAGDVSLASRAGAWQVLDALADLGVSADSHDEPRLDEIELYDEALVRRRLMTVMKRVPGANRCVLSRSALVSRWRRGTCCRISVRISCARGYQPANEELWPVTHPVPSIVHGEPACLELISRTL